MTIITRKLRFAVMAIALLTATVGVVTTADAGCLREYGKCGTCARYKFWNAIASLDFSTASEAYVDGADCDIDLLHCLVFASHHNYDKCP